MPMPQSGKALITLPKQMMIKHEERFSHTAEPAHPKIILSMASQNRVGERSKYSLNFYLTSVRAISSISVTRLE